MAYEYDEFVDAMRFGLTMSDRETTDPVWNMVDEVVNKAKAFDEISDVIKRAEFYDRDTALDVIEIVEDLEDK
ncbi:hypothetical protein QI320_03405 [Staphylococcus saprophyticus]|nr:hypothetical protein [Staphylococcus saprophyticus]